MNYDKKTAAHYLKLDGEGYNLQSGMTKTARLKNLAALLAGRCAHFDISGKIPEKTGENAHLLISSLEDLSGDENELLSLCALALPALIRYRKISGEKKMTDKAILTLSEYIKGAFKSGIIQRQEKNGNDFQVLAALNGLGMYYEDEKDESAEETARFVSRNLPDPSKSRYRVLDFLYLISGLLSFGFKEYEDIIRGYFGYFCDNAVSLNYEAANRFPDIKATDPAATSKSLEIAVKLYEITGDINYRTFARRVWLNGLQFCQRITGGVGTDTFTDKSHNLKVAEYEIPDFITPLYGKGLETFALNKELLAWKDGTIYRDSKGRFFMGDKLFAKDESGFFGRDLIEIPSLTSFDKETALQLDMKLVFEKSPKH